MHIINSTITKIPEFNVCILHNLYQLLIDNCISYKDLRYKDFIECSNSMYINTHNMRSNNYTYNEIIGIIGIRLIDFHDAISSKLDYYPMRKKHMYRVEFLHHKEIASEDDIYSLIHEGIADKNNGFIEFVQKCELMDEEISALERNNFHKESIGTNTIWIRNPLTL